MVSASFVFFPYIRALKLQSEVYTITECHRSQVQLVLYNIKDNNMQRSITLTTSSSHLENTAKGKDTRERQTSHVAIRLKKKKEIDSERTCLIREKVQEISIFLFFHREDMLSNPPLLLT